MELEGSLPRLQVPAACPYHDPNQSSSWPSHPTSCRSMLTLSSYLSLGLPSGLLPSVFPTKTLYVPLLSPYMLHAQPISFFSIWSSEQEAYLVRITDQYAPHYVVFSIPLLPRSS